MMFVRISLNHTTGAVIAVATQGAPFDVGGVVKVMGQDCETMDFGIVEDQPFTDLAGSPSPASRHIFRRLERANVKPRDVLDRKQSVRQLLDVDVVHELPCTLAGLKEFAKTRGPEAIPLKVRAWLVNIIPESATEEMGIARGVSIEHLKEAEAIRARRDPQRGSKIFALEQREKREAHNAEDRVRRDDFNAALAKSIADSEKKERKE